jgi:hypothetical protein
VRAEGVGSGVGPVWACTGGVEGVVVVVFVLLLAAFVLLLVTFALFPVVGCTVETIGLFASTAACRWVGTRATLVVFFCPVCSCEQEESKTSAPTTTKNRLIILIRSYRQQSTPYLE